MENQRPTASIIFPEQYGEAARALGRAFIDDPPIRVVLPEPHDPVERARLLTIFFEAILGIQRGSGEPVIGVVIENKVVGAAIVEGAGAASIGNMLMHGIARVPGLIRSVGWAGMVRGIRLQGELLNHHPREPHLYLNFLGVDPDYQRHHCGSAILDELKRLAALRSSLSGVYLETGTEQNVAYYTSRGYEILGELRPLDCRMWRMLQRRR